MRSHTSSEDSRFVPYAQTRLPGPRGHRDAFSSSSEWRKRRTFRQATEPRAKREAMPALCHSLVVDSTFERSENAAITR